VDRTFVTLTSFWTVLQVNLFSLEELLNAKNNLAFCVSERERALIYVLGMKETKEWERVEDERASGS